MLRRIASTGSALRAGAYISWIGWVALSAPSDVERLASSLVPGRACRACQDVNGHDGANVPSRAIEAIARPPRRVNYPELEPPGVGAHPGRCRQDIARNAQVHPDRLAMACIMPRTGALGYAS